MDFSSPPDTIAALATARGAAALAVVRVSGPDALAVVGRCVAPETAARLGAAPSHTAHLVWLRDAQGRALDQAVATVFRAPRSATGEDVVELSCHGGDAAPQAVLRALYAAGAVPAPPGAFTERAFLNGKLDLAQAEAVADLIAARSHLGRRAALAGLEGRLSDEVAGVRQALLDTAALVELELDFSEEDVAFADRAALADLLDRADALLARLLSTARLGALARDGVRVVLGGRPNAGKSTLLNALAGADRAIVSDVPGTTRDSVEAEVEWGGLAVRLVDTAGLRETADAVEAEGTARARRAIDAADVLLYVVDAALGPDAEERAFLDALTARRPDLAVLRLANKADLAPEAPPWADLALSAREALARPERLDALRARLLDALRLDLTAPDAGLVTVNERHRHHLAAAREAVRRARADLTQGDTLALDLREALREIGLVTGTVTAEDVLGAVFSRFCIGK